MTLSIGHASISDVIALCLTKYPESYFYQKGDGLVKIVNNPIWGTLFYKVDVMKEHEFRGRTKWIFHHELIDQ